MTDNTEIIDVQMKKEYVRDFTAVLAVMFLVIIIFIVGIVGFIFYQLGTSPEPIFFKVTEHDQIIAPEPLEQPAMTSAVVLNWVVEVVSTVYTFNYRNIKSHFTKIQPYFDAHGFKRFLQVLTEAPNMKRIKPDKLIVSAKVQEAPRIIEGGVIQGRYTWKVTLPITVRYENVSILRREDIDIELYIWRVPETESPVGIKITNFIVHVKQQYAPQAPGKKG